MYCYSYLTAGTLLQRYSVPHGPDPVPEKKANQVTLCYMLDVSDLIYADIVLSSGIA